MNEAIQPIDPIAFQLGPISVHWYGVIIGVGALLGLWLALRECEKEASIKICLLISSYLPFLSPLFVHEFIMYPLNGIIISSTQMKSSRFGMVELPYMAD